MYNIYNECYNLTRAPIDWCYNCVRLYYDSKVTFNKLYKKLFSYAFISWARNAPIAYFSFNVINESTVNFKIKTNNTFICGIDSKDITSRMYLFIESILESHINMNSDYIIFKKIKSINIDSKGTINFIFSITERK